MTARVGGVPAGWFGDPTRSHRLRYWDGDRWTTWVADDEKSFRELVPGISLDRLDAPHISYREQRFVAETMVIGAPVFLGGWGFLAAWALTHGGTQAGLFLGIVWLVVALAVPWQPYVAVLNGDGSLTFRAFAREITTTVDAVYRVRIRRSRAISYIFYFDARTATLGMTGGRKLSRYLQAKNSAIPPPSNLKWEKP